MIWSDSATVWSSPLNVGNCINQHISPKAESIYSTNRLLAIIRPPAMIVFAPCVLSPASSGKERSMISVMMFMCTFCAWEVWGRCTNRGSGLQSILSSSSLGFFILHHPHGVSLRACGHPILHFPFLSTSFIPIQLTSSWPFEARNAYTGDGPLLEGKTQRRIDGGAGSRLVTFRHGILGIWETAVWSYLENLMDRGAW